MRRRGDERGALKGRRSEARDNDLKEELCGDRGTRGGSLEDSKDLACEAVRGIAREQGNEEEASKGHQLRWKTMWRPRDTRRVIQIFRGYSSLAKEVERRISDAAAITLEGIREEEQTLEIGCAG